MLAPVRRGGRIEITCWIVLLEKVVDRDPIAQSSLKDLSGLGRF